MRGHFLSQKYKLYKDLPGNGGQLCGLRGYLLVPAICFDYQDGPIMSEHFCVELLLLPFYLPYDDEHPVLDHCAMHWKSDDAVDPVSRSRSVGTNKSQHQLPKTRTIVSVCFGFGFLSTFAFILNCWFFRLYWRTNRLEHAPYCWVGKRIHFTIWNDRWR